ncbi:MAG: Gfo/Idh/MocA family oxidoreductase [Methanomicrobiales archaeon]
MDKNIAVVGSGYWGKNLVRNFHELGVLRIVCDLDEETLMEFKNTYPDIITTTSFQQILDDDNIQGIVISTPAVLHYHMVKKALLCGKDVFVEKPLSLSVDEGEDLVRIAEENGNILMVGHILQYHPAILKLKEIIENGELGKIQYIYSNRLNLGKFRTEENILWSFAPHDISVILYLMEEMPLNLSSNAGTYLSKDVADVTLTNMSFASGVKSHIFVSWLHPYKEQKLVIVGSKKMAVFDDVSSEKLIIYPHEIQWIDRIPVPNKKDHLNIKISEKEPLKEECKHFMECIENRKTPKTDGNEGLRVLKILQASQESLEREGETIKIHSNKYFVHHSSFIDDPCQIGEGTKIWHFSHVMENSVIGKNCNLGQNVLVASDVVIGDNVKVQNNVSLYTGVKVEDDVFLGPSMVFTNVVNPRSFIPRKEEFKPTLVKKGATIGANATIICGNTIGRYALVGAGAVVTRDVPDYSVVMGNPGRLQGWICQCGLNLIFKDDKCQCSCGIEYKKIGENIVKVE